MTYLYVFEHNFLMVIASDSVLVLIKLCTFRQVLINYIGNINYYYTFYSVCCDKMWVWIIALTLFVHNTFIAIEINLNSSSVKDNKSNIHWSYSLYNYILLFYL